MIRYLAVTIPVVLISYALFLAWNAPASLVVAAARSRLAGTQTSLFDPGGGAWSGHAELMFRGNDLGRLQWHANPWALVVGHLSADFRLHGSELELRGHADTGGGRIELRNLQGSAALPLLAALVGVPGGLEGTLAARLDRVAFASGGSLQYASGELEAREASLSQLGVNLGTLTLALATNAKGISGTLRNHGGDLELSGDLTLTPEGDYTLHTSLFPHPGNNRLTDGLAALLGAPDSTGRYHFDASGRLQP